MIYFVSSGKSPTGGPTLMHQGCNELRNANFQVSMLYLDVDDLGEVHDKHASLKLNSIIGLESVNSEDLLIVPEQFDLIKRVSQLNCRKIIWWLSVDNFIVSYNFHGFIGKLKKAWVMFLEGKIRDIDFINYSNLNVTKVMSRVRENFEGHWVQSYYAEGFLKENDIESMYVGDYLTNEFFQKRNENIHKKNLVVYNPRKGSSYISALMDSNPTITFVPIENLTPDGVKKLLESAKIYIDLGNHPGQDRIPREAAISGCSIVVGLRGSAINDHDIPIPRKYKISVNSFDPTQVGKLLNSMLSNYESVINDFSDYRKYIEQQERNFHKDILYAISKL